MGSRTVMVGKAPHVQSMPAWGFQFPLGPDIGFGLNLRPLYREFDTNLPILSIIGSFCEELSARLTVWAADERRSDVISMPPVVQRRFVGRVREASGSLPGFSSYGEPG